MAGNAKILRNKDGSKRRILGEYVAPKTPREKISDDLRHLTDFGIEKVGRKKKNGVTRIHNEVKLGPLGKITLPSTESIYNRKDDQTIEKLPARPKIKLPKIKKQTTYGERSTPREGLNTLIKAIRGPKTSAIKASLNTPSQNRKKK